MATIYGTNWSDYLAGDAGNDFIFGYGGDDDLVGGNGYNDYWGGYGYDWFVMSPRTGAGFSDDLVHDFTLNVDKVDVSAWGISDFSQIAALLTTDWSGNATLDAFYAGYSHVLTLDGIAPFQLIASDFVYSAAGAKYETGTGYADVLFGSRSADVLNGAGGDDVLLGGMGDDVLSGGFGIDFFDGGAGFDEVSFAYTNEAVRVNLALGTATFATGPVEFLASVEDAVGGGGNDGLTGNTLVNYLAGGNGNDTLNGARGADYLLGGNGANSFVFNTALGGGNVDTIGDFYAPWDTIRLENAVFVGLVNGTLAASRYAEGSFSTARDSLDRIVYNNATGGLFFDRDGIGGAGSVKFADIGPGLAASLSNFDFLVI